MSRVLVAMSGGVDSCAAAYLLVKQGYEVEGVTMLLRSGASKAAVELARKSCEMLGIKHFVYDYSDFFYSAVVAHFKSEYKNAKTPNPCVTCNKVVKFGKLLDDALTAGYDYIATGHYCINDGQILRRAADAERDQSYFLYPIKKDSLKKIIFPLGGYIKKAVRDIALSAKLPCAESAESREICFAEGESYHKILEFGGYQGSGDICDKSGKVIGRHKGLAFYTIGQRKGLGITGGEPYYVVRLDYKANRLIAGKKEDVYFKNFFVENINWFVEPDTLKKAEVKIRYKHNESPAVIAAQSASKVLVSFEKPQLAVTPGQSAVFYSNGCVAAGGIITEVLN